MHWVWVSKEVRRNFSTVFCSEQIWRVVVVCVASVWQMRITSVPVVEEMGSRCAASWMTYALPFRWRTNATPSAAFSKLNICHRRGKSPLRFSLAKKKKKKYKFSVFLFPWKPYTNIGIHIYVNIQPWFVVKSFLRNIRNKYFIVNNARATLLLWLLSNS